jgi:Zn-dependent protease/predicted transcriptional regulator
MLFGDGITLGKLFGITIRIDYSWFIVFALISFSLASDYFPINYPRFGLPTNIVLGLTTTILFFASALIHELSHSLVARSLGLKIERITLFVFGGAAELTDEPKNPSVEFKMAIVGPLSSFFLGTISLTLLNLMIKNAGPSQLQAVLGALTLFNFGVGLFNLLPGYPLDGGRILRSLVWVLKRDRLLATRVAASGGKVIGLLLIFLGLTLFFFGNILSGLWLAVIGFFLNFIASASTSQTELKNAFLGVKVKDLMTKEVFSLGGDLALTDVFERYFLKHKLSGYPVMENGKLIGMVYVEGLAKKGPVHKTTKLLNVTTKLTRNQIVTPETPAMKALIIMAKNRLPSLPVFEEKNLVGVISQTDLSYFLTMKSVILR